MGNVMAIAHKEIRSYFASPVAYVVFGFSAILFGWFFINLLYFFDRASMQAGGGFGGPQTVNVNEGLIRPVFLNASIIILVVLPMHTNSAASTTHAASCISGADELAPITTRD